LTSIRSPLSCASSQRPARIFWGIVRGGSPARARIRVMAPGFEEVGATQPERVRRALVTAREGSRCLRGGSSCEHNPVRLLRLSDQPGRGGPGNGPAAGRVQGLSEGPRQSGAVRKFTMKSRPDGRRSTTLPVCSLPDRSSEWLRQLKLTGQAELRSGKRTIEICCCQRLANERYRT
jgi:hypothetical protein